jgi:thiaminase/transcriptional activator TenA
MAFSDRLLEGAEAAMAAQRDHPFVRELAAGTLDPAAFRRWLTQDYHYLLDYARAVATAAAKATDEARMRRLLGVARSVTGHELDRHRELAADHGLTPEDLRAAEKTPTCVAYTNFLVRTASAGSLPETVAAVYPCGRGYLDVAEHMATLAEGEHRYTPFIETYTDDAFRESVSWLRELVDRCAEANPGARASMREAFETGVRLEHRFWEMAYAGESWAVSPG